MPDIRVYEDKLLVPFAFLVLLVLKPEESTDENIIVIDNLSEPTGVHDDDFLPTFVPYFLFGLIIKDGIIELYNLPDWNYYCLNFDIFLDGKVNDKFVCQFLVYFFPFFMIPTE